MRASDLRGHPSPYSDFQRRGCQGKLSGSGLCKPHFQKAYVTRQDPSGTVS
jgi:hypothetical protein